MRLFTILGVILLVVGVGLAVASMLPAGGSFWDEFRNQGAGIAALTLIPMGLVFTVIGVWFGRLTAGRQRLLREGIAGQATILSIGGGRMVVNNINYLMTFQLMVSVPGRQPYQVEHRQLVPIFAIASIPVGSTVSVLVDREDPTKLTLDLAGEAVTMRQAAGSLASTPIQPGQVTPNTLSTMQGAAPNTFTGGQLATTTAWQPAAGQAQAWGAAGLGAVVHQLARAGITIDPRLLDQASVSVGPTTAINLGAQDSGMASPATSQAGPSRPPEGRPGTAVVREAKDSGIVVQGDAVIELTLDVTPQDGAAYQVRTAALVPAAARARALPGTIVPVRIDPAQPSNVAVDWLG